MTEQKIKSIVKGWGEGCFFKSTEEKYKGTSNYVDSIKIQEVFQGKGLYNDITTFSIAGYLKNKINFELYGLSDVTVLYYE